MLNEAGALTSYTWRCESVFSKKGQPSADQEGITTVTSKNESVNKRRENTNEQPGIGMLFQLCSHHKGLPW